MSTQDQAQAVRSREPILDWYFIYSIQTSTVPVPGDMEYQYGK